VEVEREKEYRVKWQDKVEEWKQLMQQIAEEQFRYICRLQQKYIAQIPSFIYTRDLASAYLSILCLCIV